MIRDLFRRPLHGFWWLCLWGLAVFIICTIGAARGAFDGAGLAGYGG